MAEFVADEGTEEDGFVWAIRLVWATAGAIIGAITGAKNKSEAAPVKSGSNRAGVMMQAVWCEDCSARSMARRLWCEDDGVRRIYGGERVPVNFRPH